MDGRIEFTAVQTVALTAVLLLAFAASLGMAFNVDAIVLSFSVTNFQAGLVASTELGAIAAGNLLLGPVRATDEPTPRLFHRHPGQHGCSTCCRCSPGRCGN